LDKEKLFLRKVNFETLEDLKQWLKGMKRKLITTVGMVRHRNGDA